MLKKSLSLLTIAACVAVVAMAGMFAAKEQGPPGSVKQRVEHAYISTTDIGLPAAPAIIVGAVLGLGFTLLQQMLGDRLRRSSSVAGRVTALMSWTLSTVSAARLLLQPHVQTSRSSLTS
jgi:hypothetical protein